MKRTPRVAAMDYLARREHTRVELERKLSLKGYEHDEIRKVLDRLHDQGLQCDRRFAQSYAEQRARNGRGPLKIKIELIQHGVIESMADDVLAEIDVDWREIAQTVFNRKFGAPADTLAEKAKQQRFMRQRGFDFDVLVDVL